MGELVYYNFIKEIERWATAHLQINHYGYGEKFEMDGSKREEWTCFWIDAEPFFSGEGLNELNLRIYCMGKPLTQGTKTEEQESILRVHNDTREILRDFLAEVKYQNNYFQNWHIRMITVNGNANVKEMHQELAGIRIDLVIELPPNLDNCNIVE